MGKHYSVKITISIVLAAVLVFGAALMEMAPVYAAKKAKISKTKATMYVKETLKLKVTGASGKVKWSSSNSKVAKVSSKGVVTAVKKGSAKITAKTGKQKLTCKVTVKNPIISESEVYIDFPGTAKLKVSHAVGTVKWSSSDPSVATVSSKGLVTAVELGEATITAVASGVKLTCTVEVGSSIGTYYSAWNVNADLSPIDGQKLTESQAAEVRSAINKLLDRTYIVNSIVQLERTPAPSYIAKGMKEPDGTEFYQHAGPDGKGYYQITGDSASAIETLKKYYKYEDGKFKDFPIISFVCNSEGPVHMAIGDYIQNELKKIGIRMSVYAVTWDEYQEYLNKGEYTICRGGWMINKYDAVDFLEVFLSGSEFNDAKLGTGSHSTAEYEVDLSGIGNGKYQNLKGNWHDTYDVLVSYIQAETDPEIRSQLLHKGEDLLMSTGCMCPLYYYTE